MSRIGLLLSDSFLLHKSLFTTVIVILSKNYVGREDFAAWLDLLLERYGTQVNADTPWFCCFLSMKTCVQFLPSGIDCLLYISTLPMEFLYTGQRFGAEGEN